MSGFPKPASPLLSLMPLGFGAFIAGLGVALVIGAVSFLRRAVRVPGVVLAVEERREEDSRVLYPLMAFHTVDGHPVRTFARHSTRRHYDPGAAVQVYYDPRDPTPAVLGTDTEATAIIAGCSWP